MKIKRLFAVILAACMAFSTGLIGSSAENAAPTISIKGNFSVLYVGQYVEFTFGNLSWESCRTTTETRGNGV